MPSAETLDQLALDFLWEALGAGELPYPLQVRSHGETVDERASLRARMHAELAARGLIDRYGRVEAHVEDWLGVLARPDLAIDALFMPELPGRAVAVFAAASGAAGVVATQSGDDLHLRRVRGDALVSEVVALMPPAPRGAEASISLPADEFAAITPRSVRGAADGDPRAAAARLVGLPNLRGGQFGVTARDAGGRRRAPVLSWFDKPNGRYLASSSRGRDGRDWVTVAPADAQTLRHRLGQLVAEVTR
ncbi:ESX secretion-associated protein EspG [Actinokineospora guangxiensis]|uniref:ESX secretion-associated protein EspG n=1 Tax=Actinokineospora guangxiensis TaxID=1490288 RepID=A0ABW0EHB9_9PSEU